MSKNRLGFVIGFVEALLLALPPKFALKLLKLHNATIETLSRLRQGTKISRIFQRMQNYKSYKQFLQAVVGGNGS